MANSLQRAKVCERLYLALSPVVAGHSDAVVEADAEGGARRLNGVVALKGKRIKACGYAEVMARLEAYA